MEKSIFNKFTIVLTTLTTIATCQKPIFDEFEKENVVFGFSLGKILFISFLLGIIYLLYLKRK